jgi:hypothetical protein
VSLVLDIAFMRLWQASLSGDEAYRRPLIFFGDGLLPSGNRVAAGFRHCNILYYQKTIPLSDQLLAHGCFWQGVRNDFFIKEVMGAPRSYGNCAAIMQLA